MKKILIGVMPQNKIRERVLAVTRGDYIPKRNEPKIWFPSMRSVAEVLSDKNRELLKVIAESEPASIAELSELTHRATSNLSRTLKTLESYGFVELEKQNNRIRPIAKAREFVVEIAA